MYVLCNNARADREEEKRNKEKKGDEPNGSPSAATKHSLRDNST